MDNKNPRGSIYLKIFKLLIDNIVGNQGPTWNGGNESSFFHTGLSPMMS